MNWLQKIAGKLPWEMTRYEYSESRAAAEGRSTSVSAEATVNFAIGTLQGGLVIGEEQIINIKNDVFSVPPPPALRGKKPGLRIGMAETKGSRGAERILLFNQTRGKPLNVEELAPNDGFSGHHPIGGVLIRDGKAESIWVSEDWRGTPAFKTLMERLEERGVQINDDSPQSQDFIRATAKREHKIAVTQALSEGKPVPSEVLNDYPELIQGNNYIGNQS